MSTENYSRNQLRNGLYIYGGNLDMTTKNRVINSAEPIDNTDLATKFYVDNHSGYVYTGGDGINVTSNVISTDLKANSGIFIDTGEISLDLGASAISGTLAIGDGGTNSTTASGARTSLGLEIGTDVQAWDTDLNDISSLDKSNGNFMVANGTNWVIENGGTARNSLGLGSMAIQSSIDNSDWTGTDLSVANGGTGSSSAATARIALGLEIGVNVEAFDATILNDSDIGVTVEAFDATILKDADIDVTVQSYDSNLTTWAGKTVPSGTVADENYVDTHSGNVPIITNNQVVTGNGSNIQGENNLTFDGTTLDINGNIDFGSSVGTKLNLYSTTYSLGIESATLAYDVHSAAVHKFRVGTVEKFRVDDSLNTSYVELAMNSKKITGLANGLADSDAVNIETMNTLKSWVLLTSTEGTLGLTNSTVGGSSLAAYDNYRILIYCRLITNTSRVLRLLINNDSVATNYSTYYNVPSNNVNFATRNVDGIGLWYNNTIEGSRTFEIDVSGSVAINGDMHSISFKPSYPSGTTSSDCYFGGIYSNSTTKQIDELSVAMYNSVSTNTPNTTSDDMEITMQIFGSNFGACVGACI